MRRLVCLGCLGILASVALVSLAGCGKKGNPRPPELVAPERISDLRAEPQPRGVVLTWDRPRRYMDGNEIRDLGAFVLFRKEIPADTSCPDCPVPYRERATVEVEDRERFIKKKQYRFVDAEVVSGKTYRYRILSRLLDGTLSEPSNEVEIVWRP